MYWPQKIGGFGLGEVGGVEAGEGDAALGDQLKQALFLGKDALGSHQVVAAQLSEEVD